MSIKRLFVLLSLAAVLTLSACSAVPIVQAADAIILKKAGESRNAEHTE